MYLILSLFFYASLSISALYFIFTSTFEQKKNLFTEQILYHTIYTHTHTHTHIHTHTHTHIYIYIVKIQLSISSASSPKCSLEYFFILFSLKPSKFNLRITNKGKEKISFFKQGYNFLSGGQFRNSTNSLNRVKFRLISCIYIYIYVCVCVCV